MLAINSSYTIGEVPSLIAFICNGFHLSSDGTGIYIGAMTSQIAVQTSKIICLAVETPIQKL